MPAIRDKNWAYTAAVGLGITIPICNNSSGDLLLVYVMSDTASAAMTCAGYQKLAERTSTVSQAVFWKISGGSETDPVVVSATSETFNGCVIAIRDVDVKSPFSGVGIVAELSSAAVDAYEALGNGTITGIGQSFVAQTSTTNFQFLANANFYLKKNGSPTGNMTAKLYAHSGVFGTSSVPTGAALATSDTIDVTILTTSPVLTKFIFPTWVQMSSATNYVITLEYSGGDASNYVQVGYDTGNGHGGNYSANTGAWAANNGRDCIFGVYKFLAAEGTEAASFRAAMTTSTTERDNSLIIYGKTASAVALANYIEGPVNHLTGGDGAAESMGVGWAFQKTAGNTPSDVYYSQYASVAGTYIILMINPPSTGATVIPPYIAADNCIYCNPIHGVTAWNSDTALAATADTNFGTTLGGITANDGTVAAIADTGINSFHSTGGVTNAASATAISGAELVFSATKNVGTKNLLCHVRPSTPANLQRYASVATGKGLWMGMRSTAGNYKIWQVGGADVPWGSGAHIPIIINSGAANAKATGGTLSDTAVKAIGFWVSGLGVLTCQMGFASAWIMDTVVIAGGNSTEPLTISGIVPIISTGKERMAAILQGAKQMLLLTDLQIGDGGTNPVYIELDGSAIEFPRQYNAATKEVNYNSTDNLIGITYYAGASDTIIHKNSVLSSASKYKFGIHPSSSTSATYNFEGTQVIGAGDIILTISITITGLIINGYSSMSMTNLNFDAGTILNVPTTNDSLTTNTSTLIENSTIDTSLVTAGNRWCTVTTPVRFENNNFTGGGGHAIRITDPGTYTFVGNTFTSYGPNIIAFHTTNDVSSGSDTITETGHGYTTGAAIEYRKQGGSQAIGLTDATTYYVRAVDANTLAFYTSSSNATTDTSRIDLTAGGSETHYISSLNAAIYNDSGGAVTLNISNSGTSPSIRNGASASTTVNNTITLTLTGLQTGSDIVILAAGTETERVNVDANAGTTYAYGYTTQENIDVGVFKAGYVPFYVRTYALGASNGSLPIAQVVDRNYLV